MDCFVALLPCANALRLSQAMTIGRLTSLPAWPILHRRMRRREARAALTEQFLAQRSLGIGVLVAPSPNQFRHQHVDDILEISRRNRKRDVQAIDVGLVDPCFDRVGDLFRGADHDRPDAADADMLRDLAHGPDPVRIGAGDVVHRGAAGIVLDVANLLVEIVGREIDAGPAGHQRKRTLGADVADIVGIFGLGFSVSSPKNNREHAEHQDFRRVAAGFRGEFANAGDTRRDDLG